MKSKVLKLLFMFLAIALLTLPTRGDAEAVSFARKGNTIEVSIGGKPFTVYHFDPKTSKAYLQPLRSANGIVVTRGFPIGDTIPLAHQHDPSVEPHQRAMYFGHGNINGYDFWAEEAFMKYYTSGHPAGFGRMVFRKIDEMSGGPSSGTIRATFDLEGPDHKPFSRETQEFIFRGDKRSRIIDCKIVIHANHGPVKFGDTKEGTFAIRLAPELDAPRGAMVDSKGGQGETQIWGKRADWVNVDGVIDGRTLGVAIFDSPKSFRHPTYWHARGYGLLAANPFGLSFFLRDPKKDGSYIVPAGKSIHFQYRVFIHDGNYKQARVAERYSQYAAHHDGQHVGNF
ncbi:MAG: PmoA family protein [Acidobacteriaceae bacterium]